MVILNKKREPVLTAILEFDSYFPMSKTIKNDIAWQVLDRADGIRDVS